MSSMPRLFQSESARPVLNNPDLIKLSKSGLSDAAIIERIRCSETKFKSGPDELKHLRFNGVSEAVIREMRRKRQSRLSINCGETSSSSSSVEPQGVTGVVDSKTSQLTPAQLKAQEEATARANPSVPISSDTTRPVPDSRTPSQEPMTAPVATSPGTKTGSLRRPHNQRRRKRNKIPRKQGDPS
jgi:hypothetical protein